MESNDVNLKPLQYEHLDKYIFRISENKKSYEVSWQNISDLVLRYFDKQLSKDYIRHQFYGVRKLQEIKQTESKDTQEIAKENYKTSIEINKDGTMTSDKLIVMSENDCKDVEFLLKAHGYDSKFFELTSAKNNIWNVYSKQDGVQTLYSSKINIKPRIDDISMEELKEWFNTFDRKNKTVKDYSNTVPKDGLLLEIPLVDVHYNKRTYEIEVGKEYGISNTEEDFLKVISNFIERVKGRNIEKIIFPIGNDFANIDNTENSTTKLTRQDVDVRWQEMFLGSSELLIKAIDMLSEVSLVEIFYVPGNHDQMVGFHLTQVLSAWYRNDERVTVDTSPKARKYVQYGKCLIGYTHGNKEKNRIFGLMQTEEPKLWGDTIFREWHCGHFHHEQTKENQGVIVKYLSSISPTDAWHYESGYVGSLQKAQAFLWDKEKGLMDVLYSYV